MGSIPRQGTTILHCKTRRMVKTNENIKSGWDGKQRAELQGTLMDRVRYRVLPLGS